MKIKDEFNKIKEVMISEKNFMIFLVFTLINSILIEGVTVFVTIPWIMLAAFLLKVKYKDTKMIVFHAFFSLVMVGIVSGKISFAAVMCFSGVLNVYAGLMLYTVTKYIYDKTKSVPKKVIKTTVCLLLIVLALMINSAQYGSFGTYLKASSELNKYIKQEYDYLYAGNVYYNFTNNLYYIEVYHNDDFGIKKEIFYNPGAKINKIYDWYKEGVKEKYEEDIANALVVFINSDDKLANISKEDIKVSLNIQDIHYKINDTFSYKDSVNITINLKIKYENIVEYNNYVYSMTNKIKEINLKYNEVVITSLANEEEKSYYKIQIANGMFPTSLKEIEEKSYVYKEN